MSPDDYMQKASRALASAHVLLHEGDTDGACNRAYYAMFDAAHAALLQSGAHTDPGETRKHRNLIAAFGKHLVLTGLLPAELGRTLNQVEKTRLLADYTGEEIDSGKARWAVDQAESFVAEIARRFSLR